MDLIASMVSGSLPPFSHFENVLAGHIGNGVDLGEVLYRSLQISLTHNDLL